MSGPQPAAGSGVTPKTRRLIIFSLTGISVATVVAEVVLRVVTGSGSDAMLTVAATATGGICGIAVPQRTD